VAPLREAAAEAAWTQWGAIGFGATARRPARAIVDPEALVLASLALGEHERRLTDVMQYWLGVGVDLLSVGRLRALQRDYGDGMRERVRAFAASARAAGGARWAALAGKARATRPPATGKEPSTADLRQPSTIMLRLRLAMGVGIKADALALLVGGLGGGMTVRDIATSLGYQERAVRRAVEDLVAARFVAMQATSPVRFHVRFGDWEALLGVDADHAPVWRGWHQLYIMVAALDDWARRAEQASWTDYVVASKLRDSFDEMRPGVARAYGGEEPDWSLPPERWFDELELWTGRAVERLNAVV